MVFKTALIIALSVVATTAPARPERIVSLNLCTDSMLLELAQPERIASLTHLSRDPELSFFAEQAAEFPINHGIAEEILLIDPDLIFAGTYSTQTTTALLSKLGYRIVSVPPADSLAAFRHNFRVLGSAIGETERAERLLAAMDARIAAAASIHTQRSPRAVLFRASGFTIGSQSLLNELLMLAGFNNVSAELQIREGGFLSIENLVMSKPDLIVFGDSKPDYPSLAHAFLQHPALRRYADFDDSHRSVMIPPRFWACGGTFAATVVERLAATKTSTDPSNRE